MVSAPHMLGTCNDAEPHQGWKGSTKARHLVLALRDQYTELYRSMGVQDPTASEHAALEDTWALPYISILRVQPLIEALDDDASGFVSISEVNAFTSARPENWRSVLLWTLDRNEILTRPKTQPYSLDSVLGCR
jgi:hypothetical protein